MAGANGGRRAAVRRNCPIASSPRPALPSAAPSKVSSPASLPRRTTFSSGETASMPRFCAISAWASSATAAASVRLAFRTSPASRSASARCPIRNASAARSSARAPGCCGRGLKGGGCLATRRPSSKTTLPATRRGAARLIQDAETSTFMGAEASRQSGQGADRVGRCRYVAALLDRAAMQVGFDLKPVSAAEAGAIDLQILHDALHVIAGLGEWDLFDPVDRIDLGIAWIAVTLDPFPDAAAAGILGREGHDVGAAIVLEQATEFGRPQRRVVDRIVLHPAEIEVRAVFLADIAACIRRQ